MFIPVDMEVCRGFISENKYIQYIYSYLNIRYLLKTYFIGFISLVREKFSCKVWRIKKNKNKINS